MYATDHDSAITSDFMANYANAITNPHLDTLIRENRTAPTRSVPS